MSGSSSSSATSAVRSSPPLAAQLFRRVRKTPSPVLWGWRRKKPPPGLGPWARPLPSVDAPPMHTFERAGDGDPKTRRDILDDDVAEMAEVMGCTKRFPLCAGHPGVRVLPIEDQPSIESLPVQQLPS